MDSILFSKLVFKVVKKPELSWAFKTKWPALFFKPHMQLKEYYLLKELCKNKQVIVEYGSGGSTVYFLKQKKRVYSVESDADFYRLMCGLTIVKHALCRNLTYRLIDLGPTAKWGIPVNTHSNLTWPDYYTAIWKDVHKEEKIDVVFIDGRFRVSCCLYSILRVLEKGCNDTLFIIHDFWLRKSYEVLLEFLDEYKSMITLASFTIKKDVDAEHIKRKLEEYALEIT